MAKGDDIQDRLIDFSVKIIKLCGQFTKEPSGTHLSGQLLRSGTSPASNYGEARGAESRKDFVHKLGVIQKELNESIIWLEIAKRSELLSSEIVYPVLDECNQLAKIIGSSLKTVKGRR